MESTAIKIEIGDYIASDFMGWMIQGIVKSMGTLGKGIPAYKIETFNGKTEYIIQGQARLYWKANEIDTGLARRDWHD